MAPFINLPLDKSVLKPLYSKLLPKLKVNQHFSSIMVQSVALIGGLGLPSLEQEQLADIVGLVISLFPLKSPTSYYLKESLELMQIEVGIDTPVLESNYKKYAHLATLCWLHQL